MSTGEAKGRRSQSPAARTPRAGSVNPSQRGKSPSMGSRDLGSRSSLSEGLEMKTESPPGKVYIMVEEAGLETQLQRAMPMVTFIPVSPKDEEAAKKVLSTAEVVIGSPSRLIPAMGSRWLVAVKWIQLTTPDGADVTNGVRETWATRKAELAELIAKLEKELENPRKELAAMQQELDKRMEKAKPQLDEARKAVENVKVTDLAALKTMSKPPDMVRLTLEACGLLLFGWETTKKADADWERARKMTAQTDFIRDVVRFDPMEVSVNIRQRLRREYLSIQGFNHDTVYYASKACGPLYIWLSRMAEYVELMESFHPLPSNIKALKAANADPEAKLAQARLDLARLQQAPFLITRFNSDRCSRGVAEYCLAQVLMRERQLALLYECSKQKDYNGGRRAASFRLLSSLNIGVIGVGKVGSECCRLFRGLGVRVYGFGQTPRKELVDKWCDTLPELLESCDYSICCLPATVKTCQLMGSVERRPGKCLINIGEAQIGPGCSIQDELHPLTPESPLWSQRDFVTPHVAGLVSRDDIVEVFRQQWDRWATGQRPLYAIPWE